MHQPDGWLPHLPSPSAAAAGAAGHGVVPALDGVVDEAQLLHDADLALAVCRTMTRQGNRVRETAQEEEELIHPSDTDCVGVHAAVAPAFIHLPPCRSWTNLGGVWGGASSALAAAEEEEDRWRLTESLGLTGLGKPLPVGPGSEKEAVVACCSELYSADQGQTSVECVKGSDVLGKERGGVLTCEDRRSEGVVEGLRGAGRDGAAVGRLEAEGDQARGVGGHEAAQHLFGERGQGSGVKGCRGAGGTGLGGASGIGRGRRGGRSRGVPWR